ncbi:uncharacterized protein TEOVI_000037700 [Trypanosoma equiperdum]|uniref:Uncharacterized protein n=2 Tax=Trypanozoon TaxID=39700 RepID=Q586Q2_TRYB2|nr:hypothetical protein, conserved [Trypanosoma brucei brucei TREU927]AAQ15906.1 hypothetical protein, conserved [Trypanosoma brucei brucei TREU927]AAX80184.1 hypothetical protein, conserved [Trypanosoma brucei]SCU66966.1 hypothetical protein, conserved [Trypanosoma equiperdum]
MIFGSEPPLYLKPVGRRGLRRHEADELQHYPNYVHPVCQQPDSAAYISEPYRLHPALKAVHELRHQQNEGRERQRIIRANRMMRVVERNADLKVRRDMEFEREQEHWKKVAGVSTRNEPSNGLDTVTLQCRTAEARQAMEYKEAVGKSLYYARQKQLAGRRDVHGYNIISGEPLKPIIVPPLPPPISTAEDSHSHQ